MKILIVGAGGFIGGFIAREALNRGYETYVAVRETTSRRYLKDERLKFVVLDYENVEQVQSTLSDTFRESGAPDYVIYNLGATKALNYLQFRQVNYQYLCNFVTALKNTGLAPKKFLYMSSLSAIGEYDEDNYTPAKISQPTNPNTAYGMSKLQAENYLENISGLPYIIFRPTGVYGPHEKDYLMMIKSIDRHFDFSVGFKKQLLTFIYVDDLVSAMYDALASDAVNKKYFISEGRVYTQDEFRKIVAEELGVKFVIPIKMPLWALYIVSFISEKWGKIRMKPTTLNLDKYKIMRQRNWDCDISDAVKDFGFKPKFSLRDGIKATVAAYKASKNS